MLSVQNHLEKERIVKMVQIKTSLSSFLSKKEMKPEDLDMFNLHDKWDWLYLQTISHTYRIHSMLH